MSSDEQAKFRKVNRALIRAVPELARDYEREIAAWGEEMGPHVIYGSILNPYLSDLLKSDEQEVEPLLERIFSFLEELAADPDPAASNVAITTVAEHLETDPESLTRARTYMGPRMAEHTRTTLPYRLPRRLRRD